MAIPASIDKGVRAFMKAEMKPGEALVAYAFAIGGTPGIDPFVGVWFVPFYFWMHNHFLMVTDRRAILTTSRFWSPGPSRVVWSVPRDRVTAELLKKGFLFSKFRVSVDGTCSKFFASRIYNAAEVVETLSSGVHPTPGQ